MNKNFFFNIIILICSAGLLFAPTKKDMVPLSIAISTTDSNITIKGRSFKTHELAALQVRLGKPDRIKQYQHFIRYEEYGFDDQPPTSSQIAVTDYYYIYDKWGIMLYTSNGLDHSKVPVKMSVHFANKRTFTNTALPPYSPITAFTGKLTINAITVSPAIKPVPDSIHYRSKDFRLYNMLFGVASISTVIDRLYSVGTQPYLLLYLDNEKSRKISYIEIE